MDTVQIFKKAANLVWRYKSLWLFGFLLALTVNNATFLGLLLNDESLVVENRLILSNYSTIYLPGEGITLDLRSPGGPTLRIEGFEPGWYRDLSPNARLDDVRALLISFGVVVLICILLSILLRYPSQAGLIRMVDENERSGEMVGVRDGLRLGWSRIAVKLFLIDLTIILIFAVLFTLAVSPFFLFLLQSASENAVIAVGIIILGVASLLLFTLLASVAGVLLSITRPVMVQACAVDGLGVWQSIRQGFTLLKTRFGQVLVTWLVWFGVRLGWMIVIIPVLIILSPLLLIAILAGVVIGAGPALVVYAIANQFVNTVFAWIIGGLFGLPLFFIVSMSPIFFLSGLVEVFKSSFWTLSYREFRPLSA